MLLAIRVSRGSSSMHRPLRLISSIVVFVLVSLLAVRVGCAQPPAAAPAASVTMERAVELALQFNRTLRAQRFNVDQSKANEVTAALKPNPVFTGTNQDFPVFTPGSLTWNNVATT